MVDSSVRTPVDAMSVFDGTLEAANLIYQSARQGSSSGFERTEQMTFGGATWTIGWNRGRAFGPVSRAPSAWAVGSVELASLLLAGILAPAQLDEHIGGSSHRFLMQISPVAILFAVIMFLGRDDDKSLD